MKLVILLFLFNALFLSNGLLKKSQSKKAASLTNIAESKLNVYARAVFKELNEYRKDNGFEPYIKWLPTLVETTTQEAQNIADQENFGQHTKFHKWKKAVSNRYFTELSVLIDTRQDGLPSPKVFGMVSFLLLVIFNQTVLYALEKKEKFYLIHAYTQGAVSVIQNPKKKYQYIAVIHLIKKTQTYSSCLEAYNFGDKSNSINILIKGKKKKMECNHEYGGGWTLIHEMDKKMLRTSTTDINDYGLSYTQIYFKGLSDLYSAEGGCGNYKMQNYQYYSKGWNFVLNWLKFGNAWYSSQQTPWGHPNAGRQTLRHYSLNDVQKIGNVDKCSWANKQHLEYCSQSFILKKKPTGRLTGISDTESFMSAHNYDNCYHYHFKLYVK